MLENEFRTASPLWEIILSRTRNYHYPVPFPICPEGRGPDGSALDHALRLHALAPRFTVDHLRRNEWWRQWYWWPWDGHIGNFRCILKTKEWDWSCDSQNYHCKHIGDFLIHTDYHDAKGYYPDLFLNKRKMSGIQESLQNHLTYTRTSSRYWKNYPLMREGSLMLTNDIGDTKTDEWQEFLSADGETWTEAKRLLIEEIRAKGYDLSNFVSMVQNHDCSNGYYDPGESGRYYDPTTHITWYASVYTDRWVPGRLNFSIRRIQIKRVIFKQTFENYYCFPMEVKLYVFSQVKEQCYQDDYSGTPKQLAHAAAEPEEWTCTELQPVETYTRIAPILGDVTFFEEHDVDFMPAWEYQWQGGNSSWQGPWGLMLYRPYLAD